MTAIADTPWRRWKPGVLGREYKRALHGYDLLVYRERTRHYFQCNGGNRDAMCTRWTGSIDGGPPNEIGEHATMREAMAACEAGAARKLAAEERVKR